MKTKRKKVDESQLFDFYQACIRGEKKRQKEDGYVSILFNLELFTKFFDD